MTQVKSKDWTDDEECREMKANSRILNRFQINVCDIEIYNEIKW